MVIWLACSSCSGGEEGAATAGDVARGRTLYLRQCALCHGERADGRGARRSALEKPPVDFTDRAWRRRATPARVAAAIRDGVRGTPMPAWKGTLAAQEIDDLAAYLLAVAPEGPP
jgi:high-affinity iron transporter